MLTYRGGKISRDKNTLRRRAVARLKRRTALRAVLTAARASELFIRINGS